MNKQIDHPLQKCRAKLKEAHDWGWTYDTPRMHRHAALCVNRALSHLEEWGESVGLDKWEWRWVSDPITGTEMYAKGPRIAFPPHDPVHHIEAALASLSMGGELEEAWREYEYELFSAMYFDDIFKAKKLKSTRAYNLTRAHLLAAAGNSKGKSG